jgi:hypothetical protein
LFCFDYFRLLVTSETVSLRVEKLAQGAALSDQLATFAPAITIGNGREWIGRARV